MIDLHAHTKCSDGGLTPTELVERAFVKGVRALAVTDHDTCAGNGDAVEAGKRCGVEVIPGVEFSIKVGGYGVHLLGYGVEIMTPRAKAALEKLAVAREERLVRMVSRLNELGAPITSKQVRQLSGGDVVGRLHIAKVMVQKRFVPNLQAAFVQYLGKGGLAYVDRERLEPEDAISIIHEMGGVSVLAHPGVIEREYGEGPVKAIDALVELGLAGIEAYYSRHTPEQTERYSQLAAERNLLVTGGSDFHSPTPDGIELGKGYGNLRVPEECFVALKAAIADRRAAQL